MSWERFGTDRSALADSARMECGVCWHVYDPAEGDDMAQIAPGTPFAALPDDWCCPTCDTAKERFLALDDDPAAEIAARLEAVYRRVHATAMRDVPVCNDALAVEAVGLAPWRHGWLGILITPWFINLVYLPGPEPGADWDGFQPGDKAVYAFPAGRFDFVKAEVEGLGRLQSCSLFSPVQEFADQATARLTAQEALKALNDADNVEDLDGTPLLAEEPQSDSRRPRREGMTRRGFLRGGKDQPETGEHA